MDKEKIKIKYFYSRPVVVKAYQWFESTGETNEIGFNEEMRPYVRTLEGKKFVRAGDWIVIGLESNYVFKDDYFRKNYILVENQ